MFAHVRVHLLVAVCPDTVGGVFLLAALGFPRVVPLLFIPMLGLSDSR